MQKLKEQSRITTKRAIGKLLKDVTNKYYHSVIDFYNQTYVKAQKEYQRMIEISEQIPVVYSELTESKFQ